MELLTYLILGIVTVAITTSFARRLGVAGPLLLVAIGLVASLFLPAFTLDPEIILVGVLPPLLYAAAVRVPAIEFRRDFGPIAGLAVLLVVISALALGAFFYLLVPGLGFPLAVALGAILSPTDAVATSIAKKLGLSPRVVTMLEGESLLNDATALVLLRSAIAAVAAGFSFWGTVGTFAWGVFIAVVVGAAIGWLNLSVRALLRHPAASTALGFIAPFVAYLPAEELNGSGLVAAVVAGIVTGQGSIRRFTAEERTSDELNWRTVEFILEGAVFLIMGLELRAIVSANFEQHNGPGVAIMLALTSLAIILVVRAGYVALLVQAQKGHARSDQRAQLEAIRDRLDAFDPDALTPPALPRDPLRDTPAPDGRPQRPPVSKLRQKAAAKAVENARRNPAWVRRRVENMRARVARAINDGDYYRASPLGWKEGTIIVWAGMRGVVTLAAAQTLPADTTSRELLILTAFLVALVSLMLQGFTLPWLIRALKLPPAEGISAEEVDRLRDELRTASLERLYQPDLRGTDGTAFDRDVLDRIGTRMAEPPAEAPEMSEHDMRELRLVLIAAMRTRLTELSHEGSYASATLRQVLAELDADELSVQARYDKEQ